ncbi:hypothetical protein RB620_06710 [Paenibacillus sp. LHD-117]|uniref:hypothetical protein n=1 Tax=Paenibacillus sp. LHD-117 TaxID=3071412 RepID=UPI0027DF46A8|nr:hypothetical protein [Paenibacillus sp. LHD-117]MDQ6419128.1 hypothetical protein [Paenibacillus sp. LHD-117]
MSQGINETIVLPEPDGEALLINIDNRLCFEGELKISSLPDEKFEQVIELIFQLKPKLKSLRIVDDSDVWETYLEMMSITKKSVYTIFPTLTNEHIPHLVPTFPENPLSIDFNFWNDDSELIVPFLNTQIIRDRMGTDLSKNKTYTITAKEIIEELNHEGFFTFPVDLLYEMYHSNYFKDLAKLWAWKMSLNKPSKQKISRCINFSEVITYGCYGTFAGYINKTHRVACLSLDKLRTNEGAVSELRSLEILYSSLEYCGLRSKEKIFE